MKKLKFKIIGVLIGILFISGVVYAAQSYRVNNGTSVTVDEHGTCKKVVNGSSNDYFIPTKTSSEWSAFRSNTPSGVSLGDCSNNTSCGDLNRGFYCHGGNLISSANNLTPTMCKDYCESMGTTTCCHLSYYTTGTCYAYEGSTYTTHSFFNPQAATLCTDISEPINGSCSTTLNTCSAGIFSDTTDTSTEYKWNCLGIDGGNTASCVKNKPVNGSCSTTLNTCTSGTFSDTTDSSTQYKWNCNGADGGTTASCTKNKIVLPPADCETINGNTYCSNNSIFIIRDTGRKNGPPITGGGPIWPANAECRGVHTGATAIDWINTYFLGGGYGYRNMSYEFSVIICKK